jgi:predicted AlkP superfamily phosphohydrolase/phosphomutase
MKRVKAVWNIANDAGIPVGLVNQLVSWPVDPVRGFELSGHMRYYPDLDRIVHPVEETETVLSALRERWDVDGGPGLSHTPWITNEFRDETNLVRVSLRLREQYPVWLYIFYSHTIDSAQHRYWKYHQPQDFPFDVAAHDIAAFGDVVGATYALHDRLLGEAIQAFPAETTWLILSDHGVAPDRKLKVDHPAARGLEKPPPPSPSTISGIHSGGDAGILVLAGPAIAPGPIDSASVYDIAPTICALLGLPVPEDLRGRVLAEALSAEFLASTPVLRSGTYEGRPLGSDEAIATTHDEEMKEQLRALGYIK